MYDTQKAIVDHLKKIDLARTVKPYAGEVKDAVKLRNLLPAIFTVFVSGTPGAHNPSFRFDLLIITETRTLDKQDNIEANLQLSQKVVDYLRDNWNWSDGKYYYSIIQTDDTGAQIEAETLLIEPRFTVVLLKMTVFKQ